MTRKWILQQEISSSANKFLPLERNFFLWQEMSSSESSSDNKISSSEKKSLALTEDFFLWQKISSYDKKYLPPKFFPLASNFFLCKEISSYAKKFLPLTMNFFLWQKMLVHFWIFCPPLPFKSLLITVVYLEFIKMIFSPAFLKTSKYRKITLFRRKSCGSN